ncbi:metallophosphoesterase [Snodgrassella sp. CFCC 13594]|uniref:metallophosphoesterase n=1 Tax=Snodgrassella sp. CFCC 13594 TaxID=1775559 RepID=UPI000A8C513B|nr:metallophosphoesterase [Snodgrassella sp. CFCC 13594]
MNAVNSPLFRTLPQHDALDIVGDVHGEWSALTHLLHHLGYDDLGRHPQGRKLVFVGDLCDRGLIVQQSSRGCCKQWQPSALLPYWVIMN